MILPVAVCVCMCVCVAVCYSVSQYTPLMYLQCHVIWLVDSFRDRHRVDNNEDCKDELKDLFGGGTIDGRHGRWSAVCLYTSLHSCASVCECVRLCGYEGRRRPASMCRQFRTIAIQASERTGCDARTAGGVACVPSRTLARCCSDDGTGKVNVRTRGWPRRRGGETGRSGSAHATQVPLSIHASTCTFDSTTPIAQSRAFAHCLPAPLPSEAARRSWSRRREESTPPAPAKVSSPCTTVNKGGIEVGEAVVLKDDGVRRALGEDCAACH